MCSWLLPRGSGIHSFVMGKAWWGAWEREEMELCASKPQGLLFIAHFLSKAPSSEGFTMAPPAGSQEFKHMSLWGSISHANHSNGSTKSEIQIHILSTSDIIPSWFTHWAVLTQCWWPQPILPLYGWTGLKSTAFWSRLLGIYLNCSPSIRTFLVTLFFLKHASPSNSLTQAKVWE